MAIAIGPSEMDADAPTGLMTTLYDLRAALHAIVVPHEDALVVALVSRWLRTCRITWRSEATSRHCLRGSATLTAVLGSTQVYPRGMAQTEPVALSLATVALQAPMPSLPTRAPEQRAPASGNHGAPRATPTVPEAICPYLRDRNNEQTSILCRTS
jgi:hypothetical protein